MGNFLDYGILLNQWWVIKYQLFAAKLRPLKYFKQFACVIYAFFSTLICTINLLKIFWSYKGDPQSCSQLDLLEIRR